MRRAAKAFGKEILVPIMASGRPLPGCVRSVHVRHLVPDFHYQRRIDVLDALSSDPFRFVLRGLRSSYFRSRGSGVGAASRLLRYRRLYKSIQRHGLRENTSAPGSLPWLFASRECVCRLDGHHRASIARHLGYERMHALVVTPASLQSLPELPEYLSSIRDGLSEPDFDLEAAPAGERITSRG